MSATETVIKVRVKFPRCFEDLRGVSFILPDDSGFQRDSSVTTKDVNSNVGCETSFPVSVVFTPHALFEPTLG